MLAGLAYAPLWRPSLFVPSRLGLDAAFDAALFRPAPMPALLVLAIAGWLAWRRRGRLCALPAHRSTGLAAAGFAISAAVAAWAALTQSADLLFGSAAALVLAFGAAARGRAGSRVLLAPSLTLLLGLAIPEPLEAALVWQLQRWATQHATDLLQIIGRTAEYAGVIIASGGHEFQVIDGCSGLRGILILTLVALIVRELFARAGAREWLLLAIAPLLGHALNLVRIAWVATSDHPEELAGFAGDHTPQGLAVLGAGTLILYATGAALARSHIAEIGQIGQMTHVRAAPSVPTSGAGTLPWRATAIALAALWAIAFAVPPFPAAATHADLAFPDAGAGWQSEAVAADPMFIGTLLPGQSVHRRYQKPGQDGRVRVVELFVATEVPDLPELHTGHLFTSKLAWPGAPWWLKELRRTSLDPLGRDVWLSQAAFGLGPQHALVYVWLPRDEGLARESLRALFALDSSPWRRVRPRAVVQLIAPTPQGGPVAYDIAKRTLDAFVSDFRDSLAAL